MIKDRIEPLAWVAGWSGRDYLALSLVLAGLLGLIDFATGFEISFAIFYLIPVSIAGWYVSASAGVAISFLCAITWLTANQLAGENSGHALIEVWNSATRLGFFIVVALLLARLRRALDAERRAARHDFLTGALSGRAFYELVADELVRLRRFKRPFTLLYLDADNFKAVNDSLGHAVGDALLRRVVTVMRGSLRATDSVARLGGDEFAILLPETDLEEARGVAQKLRERLAAEVRTDGWPVTFSIGLVGVTEPPGSVEALIWRADELMYAAKHGGKDAIREALIDG